MIRPARSWGGVFLLSCLWVALAACTPRDAPAPPPTPTAPAEPALTIPQAIKAADLDQLALHGDEALAAWTDADGQTPLHLAILHDRLHVLDWLIRRGLDPCQPDLNGLTPLHRAVVERKPNLVNRLLFEACDINYRDHAWKSPADYALEFGYTDILERLAAAGADIEVPALDEDPDDGWVIHDGTDRERVRTEGDYRTWTSVSGDALEAEFIDLELDVLLLRDPYGDAYRIPITRLQARDQILARQLDQGATMVAAADLPSRRRSDRSTADRLASRSGWEVLENGRLLDHPSNDGDSFHLLHEGQEYIFRLYHVDSPETGDAFPDRVRDQALYFGITPKEAIRIGKEAKTFTRRVLRGKPITIATRWEDAMGNSALPRYFAVVVTEAGELDELLTAQGLVRIYGHPIEGSTGRLKQRTLFQLEKEARKEKRGGWATSTLTAGAR